MGLRGRQPKPTVLKAAAGNPGRRQLNANEPIPPAGEIQPPTWLGPEARRVWDLVAPVLIAMKTLTTADVLPFARYCEMQARYWELHRELMTKGPRGATYMIPGPDGKPRYMAERPEMIEFRRLPSELLRLEDRFGLSASARSGINVQGALAQPVSAPLGLADGVDAAPLPPRRGGIDLFHGGGKIKPA